MPLIVLHVGAFKTGTSFIQHTLAANRGALANHGVLYPGEGRGSHFTAVREQNRAGSPGFDSTGAWDRIVRQCREWDGPTAVISAENLSMVRAEVADRLIDSLAPHPVRIVYGARDLARSVPSQWQSHIREAQGRARSYRAYVDEVCRAGADDSLGGSSFWRTHNWGDVLARWSQAARSDDVNMITVPPSGADETLLWRRFGHAADFDADLYPLATMKNTSLGAESAELVRRLGHRMTDLAPAASTGQLFRRNRAIRGFSRRVLAQHRRSETSVVFPPELADWAVATTARLLDELGAVGPTIHGDLADLQPQVPSRVPDGSTADPSSVALTGVLDAAEFGLSRWGRASDVDTIASLPADTEVRLDAAVDLLVRALLARVPD